MAKKTKSRYQLKEKLGEGGMGTVWSAFDTVLNTDVALKMLLDASDSNALQLFYEECHKQSGLAHPNIVEIRDVGVFDEDGSHKPYLVMPMLRGTTLSTIIKSSPQPLSVERCVDIISQACRGLQAAHDCGLLHRDIKPSNLFILEDDSVKIIDFGIAHRLDVSRTVGRKGTLLYMSPEQLLMKSLTRASDVFSLAVVCYEMLTRKQPFLASSEDAIIEAIRHVNAPPASHLNPNVSVALSQVLCKAMAKDSGHRFSSVREFGEYLRRAHFDDSLAVFDPNKYSPRLEKAGDAFQQGNLEFAQELINELESEGYLTIELQSMSADVKTAIKKRTIEQLLDSANARTQDGEYRLALQRVNEILQIEPRHEDALVLQLDIEARRAESDIVDWLRVGRQHLDKFSFSHARQAAQRILEVKPGEERALQFLSQIERRESEVQRIRNHKREAYAAALEAEKCNDLTSALSKMKQVLELERQAPDSKDSGQLALYQGLYNRLHSEHEAVASNYATAKQMLEHGDYVAASALCDQFLEKFPQHTLFKALKFDTEQRWRRAISLRLIEVEEATEAEPDLDQRVRMLEQVVSESPEVPEFSRLLKGTREKRNLVKGIVSRAHELESRELYGEALVQWETLQTIYPIFPGLSFEIENVRLRRQLGEKMARKNHWIREINQALDSGEFEEGLRLLSSGLEEFPNDAEFAEIRTYIRQHQELAEQAEKLICEGRKCLDSGDLPKGLERLRDAYEKGSKVKRAKAELIEGLLCAARSVQNDPSQARIYLQEILHLDPGNHAATGLLRFLDDQMEYQRVDETLSQARQLRTNSDLKKAIAVVQQMAAQYPNNVRLRQTLREMDASFNELRARDLEVVRRKRLLADSLITVPSLHEHLASVEHIVDRYGDDEEFQNESRNLRERLHTIAATISQESQNEEQTSSKPKREAADERKTFLSGRLAAIGNNKPMFTAIVTRALLLAVAASLLLGRRRKDIKEPPPQAAVPRVTEVSVSSAPSGAHIFRDGQEVGTASPSLSVTFPKGKSMLEARLDGYKSQSQMVDPNTNRSASIGFTMSPLSQQLQVIGQGDLTIDGGVSAMLPTNSFQGELENGDHTLHWIGKDGYDATFDVHVQDGKPAILLKSLPVRHVGDALLVSVFQGQAHLYTSSAMPISLDDVSKGVVNNKGIDLTLPAGLHTITARSPSHLLASTVESSTRRLLLITFGNTPKLGSLTVLTNVNGMDLTLLHGKTVARKGTSSGGKLELGNLPAGSYSLHASAPSVASLEDRQILIKQGEETTVSLSVEKSALLVRLRVRTLPGASILVDGNPAGITNSDGLLWISSLPAGAHRIEARRNGMSSNQNVTLSDGPGPNVADLKLDRGTGAVTLQLYPADSVVTVFSPKGEQVAVNGSKFDLPEGRYHFIARANGYVDRGEAADVSSDAPTIVDLKLSPIPMTTAAPVITGWAPSEWTIDQQNHTLVHRSSEVGTYSLQPSRGKFIFAGSIGRGFLLNKPKIEWVVNYRSPNNYLLFSLDRTGLERFVVSDGKKTQNGSKVPVSEQSVYQIMLQIAPGRIITWIGNGHGWKQLSDWKGLPEDVDAGKFGFKGPVKLSSFSYMR